MDLRSAPYARSRPSGAKTATSSRLAAHRPGPTGPRLAAALIAGGLFVLGAGTALSQDEPKPKLADEKAAPTKKAPDKKAPAEAKKDADTAAKKDADTAAKKDADTAAKKDADTAAKKDADTAATKGQPTQGAARPAAPAAGAPAVAPAADSSIKAADQPAPAPSAAPAPAAPIEPKPVPAAAAKAAGATAPTPPPAAERRVAEPAAAGASAQLAAAAAPEPRWAKGFALRFALGLPMYEKINGNVGVGYPIGSQTALDFAIEPAYFVTPKVALGLVLQPGVLAQTGQPDEKRFRFALSPTVRYYPIKYLYLRGGFLVPVAPDPSFGMLYGLGVAVGRRFQGLFEVSMPVTFAGEKQSYAIVLSFGFDYRLGSL